MVEQFADSDKPFAEVRAQEVAVMFADIVGFTSLAERSSPEGIVLMLREFHRLVEESVFDHGGTLDKYLGDGVMVTFGTPTRGKRDASDALCCANDLLQRMESWNQSRASDGHREIRVSIGVHFGSVVLGDIGTERRLEYATLGDTVNVASRLEEMTRSIGCHCVVSNQLVNQIKNETDEWKVLIESYTKKRSPERLRGRDAKISIWFR